MQRAHFMAGEGMFSIRVGDVRLKMLVFQAGVGEADGLLDVAVEVLLGLTDQAEDTTGVLHQPRAFAVDPERALCREKRGVTDNLDSGSWARGFRGSFVEP